MKDDSVAPESVEDLRGTGATRQGVMRMLAPVAERSGIPFRVVLASGTVAIDSAAPAFSFVFRTKRAQRRVALQGYVGLLEAYFDGGVDIEGDLALAFRAGFESGGDLVPNPIVRIRNRWHERRFSNRSHAQAKANAIFHYGLGAPFYRLWLDLPAMMYTCAYWSEGTTTLEEAQRNKMDHVCRKVRLSPGETFVDVGSGWGGLLFHALEHYGAIGTGINTTTLQVEETRAEIARRGLADKLSVVDCDFREIPGQYDKLLSIGTLEHAGRDQLSEVIRAHANALKPGGLGVIHFIGHVGMFDTEFFIRRHIFPGGWIPSLAQAIEEMERSGLEVVDVENLRRHYALTLDQWAERFDRNWEAIRGLDPQRFDERFRRTWRTYLLACAEMFRARNGRTHLFQVTVSKGGIGARDYPMSRAFLYQPGA
jgi:cyclopropane-fatty-acyl-phospholipid synthase